ncbi:MAG: chitosanase [Alphaproteobacteria bacterium]|nr:chitosanase [Alphaproteobacteria bacterium]
MQVSAQQKATAQAIVNIFETGSVRGSYGDVTLLPGDSGQLTYGRSQTTLASGNLFLLIQAYCARNDGTYSALMRSYLPKLEACDTGLNSDMAFRGLLRDAGDDPVMQEVQDVFFDKVYWDPAARSADVLGAQTALGGAIVYDSTVHGSWAHVRDLTRQQFGELRDIGEDIWMSHYVDTRRNWLATYPNALLHKTVYRMDAFKSIIQAGNWKLGLPLVVRGLAITPDALANAAPVKVAAETGPRRLLLLKTPPMSGSDVTWLQQRLSLAGIKVEASGVFDAATDAAVRAFQKAHDLKADGVVGPVTRTSLEDVPLTRPSKAASANEPMPAVALPKPAPVMTPSKDVSAPATTAPAVPTGGDTTADIKSHISAEVQAGVQKIQATIRDEHKQLADHVSTVSGETPSLVQKVLSGGEKPSSALKDYVLKGHPALAAGASALMLAFTETRDAIAWVQAGPFSSFVKPLMPSNFPPLPQSTSDVMRFLSQVDVYFRALAASLPNEWLFRIRMAAFVLICYALYRLWSRRFDVGKLQRQLAQAEQIAAQARQIATDVKAVVK